MVRSEKFELAGFDEWEKGYSQRAEAHLQGINILIGESNTGKPPGLEALHLYPGFRVETEI